MAELDMSALIDTHLPRLFEYADRESVPANGAPYARYHEFGPERADVEIGIPVDRPSPELSPLTQIPSDEIGASELPGGLVAVVVHHGPYDTLGQSYGLLHDWIHEQGYDEGPGPWESYIDDPGAAAELSRVPTKIYWPTTAGSPSGPDG
ncbi:MAG: GyrI-like domain-containing protein [Acidimicrobiia bacterium]